LLEQLGRIAEHFKSLENPKSIVQEILNLLEIQRLDSILFFFSFLFLSVYTIFRTRVRGQWYVTGYYHTVTWSYTMIENSRRLLSQTSFSLYLHNQWTDFHKLSCAEKPQMRSIRTYMGCTKATTNDWDIRPSVAVKASSANISWMAERIRMIELELESAHQSVSNNIWCVSKQ